MGQKTKDSLDLFEEEPLDTTGLFGLGVERELSEEELACYAQAAPELAPVFEAIICNHDEQLSPQESATQGAF